MATLLELTKIKHHAVRSDGAKFLDGERNDSLNTSWLTVNSSGRVTLGPGLYDELLVVKGEVSEDQIKAWASMGAPFYDPSPMIPDAQIPSADGWNRKVRTYYQTAAPVAEGIGDIWFDTDDGNRPRWWDGSQWVDAHDKLPIDANERPVTADGPGGAIAIDEQGIRARRYSDNRQVLNFNTNTGNLAIAGDLTGSAGDFANGKVRIGDIAGKPWGDGTLPSGTAGIWGEGAGLYLRGYARLLDAGSKFDEDIIEISHFPNLNNPEVLVAAKELVSYSPAKSALSHLYVDAVIQQDGNYKVKAKTVIKGDVEPWNGRSNTRDSWTFTRPTDPDPINSKKGVYTDFFICRPTWWVSGAGAGMYSAKLYMYITNEFDVNGNPTNWKQVRSFSRKSGGSGTLNWDTALPSHGQWALRVSGSGGGSVLVSYAETGLSSAGYRVGDQYLDVSGNVLTGTDPANEPSGMSVIYMVFDKG